MSDATMNGTMAGIHSPRPHLDEKPHTAGAIAFLLVLVAGLGYAAFSIFSEWIRRASMAWPSAPSCFWVSRC